MTDKEIVDLFWARSESAIPETDAKYGKYCHYIAYRILGDGEDAKEILNDTYLKAWNTIPPSRPNPLKPFIGRIARQLSINRYEASHAKKRGGITVLLDELEECIPDGAGGEIGDSVALREALRSFIYSLHERERKVFVRRYWYCAGISEIAREWGMGESAVTVMLMRTRKKLKKYLEMEGFSI